MTNKHPLLSEYKQYLQTISVKQGTKNVYANSFYKYLKEQGIHKKEELIQQLQQEQKPPTGLYHVYGWLNISTPTKKKRKTRLKLIKIWTQSLCWRTSRWSILLRRTLRMFNWCF